MSCRSYSFCKHKLQSTSLFFKLLLFYSFAFYQASALFNERRLIGLIGDDTRLSGSASFDWSRIIRSRRYDNGDTPASSAVTNGCFGVRSCSAVERTWHFHVYCSALHVLLWVSAFVKSGLMNTWWKYIGWQKFAAAWHYRDNAFHAFQRFECL